MNTYNTGAFFSNSYGNAEIDIEFIFDPSGVDDAGNLGAFRPLRASEITSATGQPGFDGNPYVSTPRAYDQNARLTRFNNFAEPSIKYIFDNTLAVTGVDGVLTSGCFRPVTIKDLRNLNLESVNIGGGLSPNPSANLIFLQIRPTITNPPSMDGTYMVLTSVQTGGTFGGYLRGMLVQPIVEAANISNWNGAGIIGSQFSPQISAGASGTFARLTCLGTQIRQRSTASTITNAYGITVDTMQHLGGTIDNTYGLWIGSLTGAGAMTNTPYSIYTSDTSARNFFGGPTILASGVTMTGIMDIANYGTTTPATPAAGGRMFASGGALYWLGSAGTVTRLAVA